MAIEVRQMVVKSDIKSDDAEAGGVGETQAAGGAMMNCNQSQTVVVEDCMRQIKRIFDSGRER